MKSFHPLCLAVAAAAACATPQEELDQLEEYRRRATQYYEAGDLSRAEQQARMGLALDEDHAMLNLILGRTLLRWHDLSSVARSRPYLEKALDEQPEFRTRYSVGEYHQRYAEFLLGHADVLEARAEELPAEEEEAAADLRQRASHSRSRAEEHLAEARDHLEEALEENPRNPFALRVMANCYTHLGEIDLALETLDVLLDELEDSRGWKNRRLATEALSVAEEDLLRANLSEDLALEIEARGLAATLHKKRKDYDAAAAMLTEILHLDPTLDREYFNRGMCRYWTGDLASAASDMQEFLRRTSLDYDAEEVSRALDILAELEAQRRPQPTRLGD